MSYFDRNPAHFRAFFGALVVYLVTLSGLTLYRFASAPTDENWFAGTPSRLYYTAPISALSGESAPANNLLVSVNGQNVDTPENFHQRLKHSGDAVGIEIFRLKDGETRTLIVAREAAEVLPLRSLPPVAHVIFVTEDGASDRAGMEVGDLIHRINGHGFQGIFAADSILQQGIIGKSLTYEVIRDNRDVRLQVSVANFGLPFSILVAGISGILFMVSGALIGLRKPLIRGARISGLFFLAIGFALTVAFNRRGLDGMLAGIVPVTLATCVFAVFPLSLHTHLLFPKEYPSLGTRRWVLPAFYGLALIAFAAGLLWNTFAVIAMLLASLLGALIAARILLRRYRPQEHYVLSAPLKWSGITGLVLSAMIVVLVGATAPAAGVYQGYVGLPLLIILAGYLYAIGRFRLLDLDLRIRRSMQYNLIAAAWIGGIALIALWLFARIVRLEPELPNIRFTGASVEIVPEAMTSEQRDEARTVVLVLLSIGTGIVIWRIGRSGLHYIARKYHRTQYDYRKAANELTDVMATRVGMSNLARGISEKLAELMQLKRTGVLFFTGQKECCSDCAYGFDGRGWKAFCLSRQHELVDAIQKFQGEFRVDYLPSDLKEEFIRNEFQYLIPIRSKKRLVGTIFVGEKQSEATYHQEDLEFLRSIARQASVAIENAFLYGELTEQERMKHELDIARRIQLGSLPQKTPRIEGLDIAGTSIPAMEVGGDYYDYINGAKNNLTVVVGDVSGKGTSAALYMAKIQGILRSLGGFELSPRELFVRTNALLWNDLEKKSFVTAFGAEFAVDHRTATLARAGHLPLYLYQAATHHVERIVPRGIGMGLSGNGSFDAELEERVVRFAPGDIFLFITDGITEGTNGNGEQFGEQSLVKLLGQCATLSAQQILSHIMAVVREFSSGAPQHDDQTVVVVKAE